MPNSTITHRGVCEFCGEPLPVVALSALNRDYSFFGPCECAGAVAHREAELAEQKAREEAERRRLEAERYERAGIPRHYWTADVDDARYIELIKQGCGLYFTGPSGRGKTHTACSIARKLMAENWLVRFVDADQIAREVAAAWNTRETTEDAIIKKYTNASLIVIDDIGAERVTSTALKALRAIITGREANERPLIATSNLTRKDFAQRIADADDATMAYRLASRIAGMTQQFVFDGPDLRLKHGN